MPILHVGQLVRGTLFSEPMRVVTAQAVGDAAKRIGMVREQTQVYRSVTVTEGDLRSLTVLSSASTDDGAAGPVRLGLQAFAMGISYAFGPYVGLSISRVDPLPHQLATVCDHLPKLARVLFLLRRQRRARGQHSRRVHDAHRPA